MAIKFSLDFFRRYFRIPSGVKLCWCILVEKDELGERQLLGVMLCGTSKVIDVAARSFVQTGLMSAPVTYSAYPAHRGILKNPDTGLTEVSFVLPSGERILVPPTYVQDIYFRCVYSEEMLNQPLI